MKRLLASLVLAALAPLAQAGGTAGQVFAQASPSVFSISVTTSGGEGRIGSGVVVGQDRIVTNFHVVKGARSIYVKQGEISVSAWLENMDEKHDLALLHATNIRAPVISFGSGSVSVGQTVFAIGSPRGLELSLSEGLVSSLRRVDDGSLIQTTAPISPGSSGGGLFDEDGRLVGLTTAQVVNGQNLNFAVPVEWLKYVGVKYTIGTIRISSQATTVEAPPPASADTPAAAGSETPAAAGGAAATAPGSAAAADATGAAPAQPVQAQPPGSATPAPAAAPAQPESKKNNLYFNLGFIVVLLLLAKPAARWLSNVMSRETIAPAAAQAASVRSNIDRMAPYRAKAREDIKNKNQDQDTWLMALEQTRGDESRATAVYIETRAHTLYRADLDRKWAEAQARNQVTPQARRPQQGGQPQPQPQPTEPTASTPNRDGRPGG